MTTQGNQFVPLDLGLIEEGAFLASVNRAICKAQDELVRHVEAWGERAGKAKAVIDVSIELKCENPTPGEGFYTITPTLKIKLPARPPKTTSAMAGFDKARDQACLFVRETGSTEGDPNQMHLPMGDAKEPTDTQRSEA
ncbi:hypothetical protein LCGC14_0274050 [marine sediment metagenome]|uniref:Uncharacterized protein n=2 Tax=root TaxID=1 RepID=A0A9C9TFU1_9HYPH|nr:hypothetical protein [Aurantimonas coralicida]